VKMGQIGCLETFVKNYDSLLRNNPEECDSHKGIMLAVWEGRCNWIHCQCSKIGRLLISIFSECGPL
jgi:hypothetical protein